MAKLRKLVIANNKGGVGKTTLSLALALYFAIVRKWRVLLMDLDGQCNLSGRLLPMQSKQIGRDLIRVPPLHPTYNPASEADKDWNGISSSADIYKGIGAAIYPTKVPGIGIVPAESELERTERITTADEAKFHRSMAEWLEDAGIADDYDLVISDTPPSKGPITYSALMAATDLLIPSQMSQLSIEGLYGMVAYWARANVQRPKTDQLNLVGIVANQFDERVSLHGDYFKMLRENAQLGRFALEAPMHLWTGYQELSALEGATLFDREDKYKQEVIRIGKLVEERMGR